MTFLHHTALALLLTMPTLTQALQAPVGPQINNIAQADPSDTSDAVLLTLDQAMTLAIQNDPWQQKSAFQEHAAIARSVSMSTMQDPVVSIGLANLPTNGYDFNQEPMTQLKAGVSQMFPRGDSLEFQRKQQLELSQQQPFLRLDRKATVAVTVAQLWLEAYRAKASITLIENDRALFEQLGEIAQTNYASALGNTRQQDILRAELELVRIEDRLLMLSTQHDQAMEKLSEWLAFEPAMANDSYPPTSQSRSGMHSKSALYAQMQYVLPKALPQIKPETVSRLLKSLPQNPAEMKGEFSGSGQDLSIEQLSTLMTHGNQQQLAEYLTMHPMIKAIQREIAASQTAIDLAKQKYKPQWGINASYAYRDDDPLGRSRADFLSVGVSFDLPLFTANRQDKEVATAVNEAQVIKTEQRLALRSMMAGLRTVYVNYQRLLDRQQLYSTRFLIQTQQQSDAALSSYTNDEGDFTEVVRARIAVLNAELDALNIEVDLRKAKMQMGYYFVQAQSVNSPVAIDSANRPSADASKTPSSLGAN